MDNSGDQTPLPNGQGLSPVEALSTQLGKLPVFRKLQQGGTVRIPSINPLVVLVFVAAVILGSVLGIRALIDNANSDDRCREIDRSFDLFATPPPPVIYTVPDALKGTSVERDLTSMTSSMREEWVKASKIYDVDYSRNRKDTLEAVWAGWVDEQRATVLLEEGC